MSVHIPAILYLSFPLLIILLVVKALMPKLLGKRGESIVKSRLEQLDSKMYTVLNDLLIPNPKSKSGTSQIDHVVVSQYGIFVIETKNYSGRIVGKETDSYWTQVNYSRKDKLWNPLRQNYGHIQAMTELIRDSIPAKYVSIVGFTRNSELHVDVRPGTHVVYTSAIVDTILGYKDQVMSQEEVSRVVQALQLNHIADNDQRKRHSKNVKNALVAERQSVGRGVCPKCGGHLVPRRGRYGAFTGCSNFPKCTFKVSTVKR